MKIHPTFVNKQKKPHTIRLSQNVIMIIRIIPNRPNVSGLHVFADRRKDACGKFTREGFAE